jgi:hypothetical protein
MRFSANLDGNVSLYDKNISHRRELNGPAHCRGAAVQLLWIVNGVYHPIGYTMLVRISAWRRLRKIFLQTKLTPIPFVSLEISNLSVFRSLWLWLIQYKTVTADVSPSLKCKNTDHYMRASFVAVTQRLLVAQWKPVQSKQPVSVKFDIFLARNRSNTTCIELKWALVGKLGVS